MCAYYPYNYELNKRNVNGIGNGTIVMMVFNRII